MIDVHPLDAAATVADVAPIFADFAAASAAAREHFPGQLNLAYGATALETLDIFPAGAGSPLAIFIHGGYWRRLDKADFSFIAAGLVPHGVSVASLNYGLAPNVPLREIVAQCRRAVRWLVANASRFDFDAGRMSLFGHSAGGHLAAMCAIEQPVQAVISLSGLHDLLPIQQSFVNDWLHLDAAEARALSPIGYAPAHATSVYATAGERESGAFQAQGRALVDAWAAHGCVTEYANSPNDNHFTIVRRLSDPADTLTRKIAELVT